MIPKIIHFVWLSDNPDKPYPKQIQRCIDSWSKALPGYEIRKWDFSRFPKDKSKWVSEAVDAKKWAFAADYIRNYALYTEGGIYLDTDVEVLRSFDPLLHLPYFFCYENGSGCLDMGTIGVEAGNPLFKKMLDYYDQQSFVLPDGKLNMRPIPYIVNDVWDKSNFMPIESYTQFLPKSDKIQVLPCDYFSPINIESRRLESSDRTFAVHHFAATWTSGWQKHKRIIKKLVGPTVTETFIRAKRRIKKFLKH